MRKRADWMKPADDLILEFLSDEDTSTPEIISNNIEKNRNYVTQRCSALYDYGLVTKLARGVYRITEDGQRYLEGDLDASQLEPE